MYKYCNEVPFQTYECAYFIYLPYQVKLPQEDISMLQDKIVAIDKCLLPEMLDLWKQGIKTVSCCCGHGDEKLAHIAVKYYDVDDSNKYIRKMESLGYEHLYNPHNPEGNETFKPKTQLKYGGIPFEKFSRGN